MEKVKCKHQYPAQFSGVPLCEFSDCICIEEKNEYCINRTDEKPTFNSKENVYTQIIDGNLKTVDNPVKDNNEDIVTCDICDFGNPKGCDFIYYGTQNGKSVEACLIPPTPISMRKNPERPASIQVLIFEGQGSGYRQLDIPISHCPCCGRKL